jgi:hypothetical protein
MTGIRCGPPVRAEDVRRRTALVHGGSEGRQLVEHRQTPRLLRLDADRARRIRDRFGEYDGHSTTRGKVASYLPLKKSAW